MSVGIRAAALAMVFVATAGLSFGDEKVDGWIEKLAAKKAEDRTEAAFALGAMGEKATDSVDALRKTLRDKFFKVRAASAIALGKIGPKVGEDATIDLLECLDDLSPSVRRAAAKALT
ncbi:MAG: HEAT repeat domain-containing protein, partial [Planctomycetes bacterium]|nr:HEAT repeat domain-containing protein [Planctomycetota bacterium]